MDRIPVSPATNELTTLDQIAIGAGIIATRSADQAREDALEMQNALSKLVKSWRECRVDYERLRSLALDLEEAVCILLDETPGRIPIESLIKKLFEFQTRMESEK